MPSERRVLLAADGGPGIGLGHVQRTLALAAALRSEGWSAVMASPATGPLRERVEAAGLEALSLAGWPAWDGEAVERLGACARIRAVDLVVVDTYRLPPAGLAALHAGPFTLAVIDDLGGRSFACDVVVNGGAAAATLSYPSAGPRLLLGPEYALLGPGFWQRPARAASGAVRRVLVTAGGATPGALVAELVRPLAALPGDFAMDVVVGPFGDGRALGDAAGATSREVRVHADVPTLRDLALAADVAVSAAGHTLLELAWAGCPTVGFALACNQEPGLTALAARGVVRSAGRIKDEDFVARLGVEAGRLRDDAAGRAALTAAGQRLVDGQGALRVARVLGVAVRMAKTLRAGDETG